ncbi:PREDICTED: protein saal1-like [Amphimedon queenslandica]|uniref:Protein SAAL1 n=1 Tax=Amphimedon queenslandica TaxID=400682 RepID=A0A1X7ULZ3_AMPQE|nr:PREDICTED: protein saal1-like [Amphimedon queenslandica]|eukprot:XP_011404743.1 PREDICTED: protein saal1-like [Amphimedon queenslandica]
MATGPGDNTSEKEENDDAIEGTVFSRSWVLSLLVKLVRAAEETPSEEDERNYELEETTENELCLLWDLTVNTEIVSFMQEHDSVQLLVGCIMRSKYDRLTEICLGICNNIACKTDDRAKDFIIPDIINICLSLLAHSDSNVLLELSRLIITCLTCVDTQFHWTKAISTSDTFLNDISFIFSSSTNCDLLRNAATILDTIFDIETDLLSKWSSSSELMNGICEALDECKNNTDITSRLMCILQSYTTTENGIASLITNGEKLYHHVVHYFSRSYNSHASSDDSEGVVATLSFSHFILINFPEESKILKKLLSSDEDVMKYLKKLTENKNCQVHAAEIIKVLLRNE